MTSKLAFRKLSWKELPTCPLADVVGKIDSEYHGWIRFLIKKCPTQGFVAWSNLNQVPRLNFETLEMAKAKCQMAFESYAKARLFRAFCEQ